MLTGLTPIDMPDNPKFVPERGQGFVLIAESHIGVHVKGDRAAIDVFSCKPFKWASALRVARETFGGLWNSTYFQRSHPPVREPAGGSRWRWRKEGRHE